MNNEGGKIMQVTYKRSFLENLSTSIVNTFGGKRINNATNASEETIDKIINDINVASIHTSVGAPLIAQLRTLYTTRDIMMREYDYLDPSDGVVSSCLDQYADAAISQVSTGDTHPYDILGGSAKAKRAFLSIMDQSKVDKELWVWARHLCKYGESFWIMKKLSNNDVLVEIEADVNRYTYVKVGENQRVFDNEYCMFTDDPDDAEVAKKYAETMKCEFYKVIPVMLPSLISRTTKTELRLSDNSILSVELLSGASILDPILVTTRIIRLIEDAILMTRLDKSKTSRIYQVEVGSTTDDKGARDVVNKLRSALSRKEGIDTVTKDFTKSRVSSMVNEIILPVRDGIGAVTVDEFNTEFRTGDMDDLDYFRSKFYAGIKISKAYLGFEEEVPSGFGSDPLKKIDARFGKAVRRVVSTLEDGLNEVKDVLSDLKVLNANGMKIVILKDKTLEELEYANNQSTLADALKSTLESFDYDETLNKKLIFRTVLERMNPDLYRLIYFDEEGEEVEPFDYKLRVEEPVDNNY